ncbi:hypothetical protein CYMTET_38972 [Cymbomonas tetramitiformis]|uniref:Uncharacterized protein n=1 Tax=Cymbomonas tetramitiformis TaxID=36881 RepID=A0AAE0CB10_9CHLO|nr:hypothetical protein CYMTET_38972 [Cymbomonas tetramitiformis]
MSDDSKRQNTTAEKPDSDLRLVDATPEESRPISSAGVVTGSERPQDAERTAEGFARLFGKPSRPVQDSPVSFLSSRPFSHVNLVEIDTGGGKSLVGVYQVVRAIRSGVYQKSV